MTHPKIHLHQRDLPAGLDFGSELAVDCEMMGLSLVRDRLCLVQLRGRDTDIHLVQIARDQKDAPHLKALLEDQNITKIFHFARHDIATLKRWLGIDCAPLFCTKIASKLVRTYTDRHGLKDLARETVGADLNKQQQTSNWGQAELTQEQKEYAASDVLHLHLIKDQVVKMLEQEDRMVLAQACFDFLPTRCALDLLDWDDQDIFAHH